MVKNKTETSNKTKIDEKYKGLKVVGIGRKIMSTAPLSEPPKDWDEMPDWMKLAKKLAHAIHKNTWSKEDQKYLAVCRQLCADDQKFLKGDCCVLAFCDFYKLKRGGKAGRTTLNKRQREIINKKLDDGVPKSQIIRDHDVSRGTILRFDKIRKNINIEANNVSVKKDVITQSYEDILGKDIPDGIVEIGDKKKKSPLNDPHKDEVLPVWLTLAKMLAKEKCRGTWGAEEKEALHWVRELSSYDSRYLKGDIAIFVFLERHRMLRGGKAGRTTLNKHQQRKIIKYLEESVPIPQIAAKLDLSPGTVNRFINNLKSD
jgi:hypothetical protein